MLIYFNRQTNLCCGAVYFYVTFKVVRKTLTTIDLCYQICTGGHSGRVVKLLPPTSEAGVRFPARPQVGKLVIACRWSAVYSTEP